MVLDPEKRAIRPAPSWSRFQRNSRHVTLLLFARWLKKLDSGFYAKPPN